jgi:hypothetical protein
VTAFEAMGEHWFVTGFCCMSLIVITGQVCNTINEAITARTLRLNADHRCREEQRLLDMLDSSAGRLSYLREHEATQEEMAYELEHSHRLHVALGWRTDDFPPLFASVSISPDHTAEMAELFATPRRTRARSAFVEMGRQDHPDGPSTAFVRGADETSVDTLTGNGAGSGSESLEPTDDPSSRPRNRRRNIRLPG